MELNVLSQHEQALKLRALRNEVLSSNIANADTPGYKARDMDFSTALKHVQDGSLRLMGTNDMHLGAGRGAAPTTAEQLKYRVPTQPTLDGNTVETDVEQAAFAENALMYRASLAFLDGQIRSIRYALKGGD
ncbi:MAG: flagellar basal body rod protein FlgB [Gammaproteobacteria bacterium]|nr:flagellar basal body rod protein FlgB [Gammaproteobacteria bacterium]